LPNSFYLSSKPDFFDNKPWPLYGVYEGFDNKLPAQDRFEGIATPIEPKKNHSLQSRSVNIMGSNHSILVTNIPEKTEIIITTLIGRVIGKATIGNNKFMFDNIPTGIYVVRVSSSNITTNKVITIW